MESGRAYKIDWSRGIIPLLAERIGKGLLQRVRGSVPSSLCFTVFRVAGRAGDAATSRECVTV